MTTEVRNETSASAGSAHGSAAAGRAAEAALAGLDADAELLLAFPSGIDPSTAAADIAAVAAGEVRAAGMTGNGSIGRDGAMEVGCTALALGGAAKAGIGVAGGAGSGRLREAAREAAAGALAEVSAATGNRLLVLMLDTRTGDQAEAVAGAYEAAGPQVPLVGGAAGGPAPAQLLAGEALTDSVLAVAIVSPAPIGVGVAHGCRAVGVPSIVTRSDGRRLLELDGRPAADAYLDALGFGGADLDDDAFEALAVTHPLAQLELGSERIRHVLGRDGSALVCATHIPPNAAVEFTHETPDAVVETATVGVTQAIAGLGGHPPLAALIFDCAGRKRAVAGALAHEVSELIGAFGAVPPPLAGLFTHGEVGRIKGAKGDRNHAVVAVAFG